MKTKADQIRLGLFAGAILSLLWGFRLLFMYHAPIAFVDMHEDLSYGWYVPVFSLYVLWRERSQIRASLGSPSAVGFLLLVPSLFLGFIGARGLQIRFEIVGLVGTLVSLVWITYGRETMKQTLCPFLFLLFCIPLHSFLDVITIHLRLFAVWTAEVTLNGLGVEVVRQGTMLVSPTGAFSIDVAEPCSGLRSLFAMMALTAGYAYFNQPTWLRRLSLFALSIPIAILGNIVRIFTIVGIAATCSAGFATGFYHDYSGYIVFLVAIACMVACGGLITKGCEACARR